MAQGIVAYRGTLNRRQSRALSPQRAYTSPCRQWQATVYFMTPCSCHWQSAKELALSEWGVLQYTARQWGFPLLVKE